MAPEQDVREPWLPFLFAYRAVFSLLPKVFAQEIHLLLNYWETKQQLNKQTNKLIKNPNKPKAMEMNSGLDSILCISPQSWLALSSTHTT